jgi:hypothetical protein
MQCYSFEKGKGENMEFAIGLLLLAIYLYVKLMIKFCAFMAKLTMLFLISALKMTIALITLICSALVKILTRR